MSHARNFIYNFRNNEDSIITLIIEPWADEIKISKGDVVDILCKSPETSQPVLSLEANAGMLSMWFWRGCFVEVKKNGILIETASMSIESPL